MGRQQRDDTGSPHPRSGRPIACGVLMMLGLAALAGCGGPAAVTQDEVAATLVGPADVGLSGWIAGAASEAAPEGGDGDLGTLLGQTSGMSQACRDALSAFAGNTGRPSAYASRTISTSDSPGGSGNDDPRELVVAVRGYDESDPPALPDAGAAVRACPSFEISTQGQRLAGRLRAPTYDVADSAALGLDLNSGDSRTSLDLVRVRRGPNLVTASLTGQDEAANHDILARVAKTQADRVAAAG